MVKVEGLSLHHMFLAVALIAVPALTAQQMPAIAPVQILNAHKLFISNAGGDASSQYTYRAYGMPGQAYERFYSAVQSWDTMNSCRLRPKPI